jgi:primosomal protein N' (replication factor Y)
LENTVAGLYTPTAPAQGREALLGLFEAPPETVYAKAAGRDAAIAAGGRVTLAFYFNLAGRLLAQNGGTGIRRVRLAIARRAPAGYIAFPMETPSNKPPSGRGIFAEVAFNLPIDQTYSYIVPENLAARIAPGKRVEAPFGPRVETGYCVAVRSAPPEGVKALKELRAVIDDEPLIDAHMLELTRWVADYYLAGWGEALEAVLPAGVRYSIGNKEVVFLAKPREAALAEAAAWGKRGAKRRAVLEAVAAADGELSLAEAAAKAGVSSSTARAVVKLGLAEVRSTPARRARPRREPAVRDYALEFKLTVHQEQALERVRRAIESGRYQPILLFGVTGSGKTEVYLQAIEAVIRAGRQAIVLVPEISLTPQTVSRFRARFPNVAVLHSHLSAGKRHREWRAIQSGAADVVIGARSAIFAPAPRLGLVVIDEEHENTFKQETSPRYHAREVAARRAEMLGIPLILGSATPSLESFHASSAGAMERIDLPYRVEGRPLPKVEIVDMRAERDERKGYAIISRRLEHHVQSALSRREQTILFLNRRGFATYLTCRRCGWVGKCPSCDITLTFHRVRDLVLCHYCGHTEAPPAACPECGYKNVKFYGAGTERVVEEVKMLFPSASVDRMDSDTMTTRQSYTKALRDFRQNSTDILVGTQMIAKGLDFPNVTVVGVISADVSLNLPDFRASERTFDLVSQVAGRAGRGPAGGVVVVQTLTPEHFGIQAAARHDYLSFAAKEIGQRAQLGYPPVGCLARIVLRGEDEEKVASAANKVRQAIDESAPAGGVAILGPVPAPIARIMKNHRYHIIVKAADRAGLRRTLEGARRHVRATSAVQAIIDVDPLSML